MFNWPPLHETTPELADERIEQAARLVQRYGMEVPAIFFLELSKPVSFAAGSALHMATPIIGSLLMKEDLMTDYANILSDRNLLEKLICRIEALAKESDEQRRRVRQ
ncbi:MAG: hypothetical protein ACOX2K_09685 [Bacillota bacterium]|jgi:hypothetical protein